jgi:branched-chain amino acid transport system ATP-binding protein
MPSILTLEQISKRFGAVVVADNIDLTLLRGEALGIIGPNGAGKTTLFGIITGTVAADAGRVVFEGHDVTRMKPENLVVAAAFGGGRGEREVYAGCAGLLERCGLADKANRRAGTLTLLDRKRLELARALATGPRVLLLDEVAGGLVEHETAALVDLINDVRGTGVSIIWIEHVVHALIAVVDRLVVLHEGALIAEGDPAEVIRRPQVSEIYMGIQELELEADG